MGCRLLSRYRAAIRRARNACEIGALVVIGWSGTAHATELLPSYGRGTNTPLMEQTIRDPAQAELAWPGVLEKQPIYMHAPRELRELDVRPDQTTLWRFQSITTDSIRTLFERADLPAATINALLGSASPRREEGGITLVPPPEIILELSPKSRQVIYEELARTPGNPLYASPLLVPKDWVADWMQHSGLSAIQQQCIRQLFWDHGGCFAFSDISLLIRTARSAEEIEDCLNVLSLTRTFLVKLRVPAVERVDEVMRYWGAEPNHRDVASFLRSVVDTGGVQTIDLIHLLPQLCRRWLYTYPSLSAGLGGRFPDCNWTALNFFASRPEAYYMDSHSSYLELTQGYDPVNAASRLGDLICFTDRAGQIIHSCVFIADDLVFTKNGAAVSSPWLLMLYKDVEALYRTGAVSEVKFFRKKRISRDS